MDSDLLQAKQALSARHLALGFRSNVTARAQTMSATAAVAAAGRNVHAVGIGRKIVEGDATGPMAVRLYVVQKISPSLLPPRDRLPEQIDGIPTDVIESAPAFLMTRPPQASARIARARRAAPAVRAAATVPACSKDRRKRQRPLVAGISVGHHDITAGTIGYFCRSLRFGDDASKVHILSNNHVLANVNQAVVEDDIYQPGPQDGGTITDRIAALRRFKEIDLNGNPNRIDAAIAELAPDIAWRPEICGVGSIVGVERGVEDMEVRKHGRTSGYTEGRITDESYDALIGMDHNDPSVVGLFQDQIRIETTPSHPAFGLGGDSGSLVVSRSSPNAVGLYFAGPPGGSYGVANHIGDVLNELQIELVPVNVA